LRPVEVFEYCAFSSAILARASLRAASRFFVSLSADFSSEASFFPWSRSDFSCVDNLAPAALASLLIRASSLRALDLALELHLENFDRLAQLFDLPERGIRAALRLFSATSSLPAS